MLYGTAGTKLHQHATRSTLDLQCDQGRSMCLFLRAVFLILRSIRTLLIGYALNFLRKEKIDLAVFETQIPRAPFQRFEKKRRFY